MIPKLLAMVIFLCLHSMVYAADEYEPIFNFTIENVSQGTLLHDYKVAAESKDIESAIKNWELLLSKFGSDNAENIEDLTELVYLRQAYFELAKLYYLKNNNKKADMLIKKGAEYVVYSFPELDEGSHWCSAHKFCP